MVAPLLAGAVVLSCSGVPTAPALEDCAPETTSVAVTITPGSTPQFEWTPACSVALLLVKEETYDRWWISTFASSDSPAWLTTDANRIRPNVRYGQIPSSAMRSYGPDSLVQGTTYTLVLWRILPENSEAVCEARFARGCRLAFVTFTR